jgi:FMN phosphatase YigB (HAD superfamily)
MMTNPKHFRFKLVLWDWSGTIVNKNGQLLSEALDWIESFEKQAVPQGIISNEMNPIYLLDAVQHLGLWNFFGKGEYVICAGQNFLPKPDTEMFTILLGRINIKTQLDEILYIGDSNTDKTFAERCGCVFYPPNQLSRA